MPLLPPSVMAGFEPVCPSSFDVHAAKPSAVTAATPHARVLGAM
jgi:hypothetical protein